MSQSIRMAREIIEREIADRESGSSAAKDVLVGRAGLVLLAKSYLDVVGLAETLDQVLGSYVKRFGLIVSTDKPRAEVLRDESLSHCDWVRATELACYWKERAEEIDAWASRMPDAGFNDQDPRWNWWHERPQMQARGQS